MNKIAAGALAGALGTLALDASTYADIAIRGRATSTVPEDTVDRLARAVGVDLSRWGGDETARNRRSGIAALLGYATGVATGVSYGLVRPLVPRLPQPVAGIGVGAAAMIAANSGAIAAGATDPRQWGVSGWIADIVPHALFGLVTAAAFDLLLPAGNDRKRPR